MPSKKTKFNENEEAIFEDAVIYKRGEYWQFRMWLANERKYARFTLSTRNKSTAIDKAKLHYHKLMAEQLNGVKYFSITTQAGVDMYLARREKDIGAKGGITKGRYGTIKTHLEHWLKFIKRDVKLCELERTACDEYALQRTKKNKKTGTVYASVTTVENEQSTINAMMRWLYKHKETNIEGFDFPKLQKIDRGDESLRRATFLESEVDAIEKATVKYCDKSKLTDDEWAQRRLACFYLIIASLTGLRTGEQRQLTWGDIEWTEWATKSNPKKSVPLVKITVRAETSKVRKTRSFFVPDNDYFKELRNFVVTLLTAEQKKVMSKLVMFSLNGENVISERAILYHFEKLLKLAEIEGLDERDLVPYSFRHYFITRKILNGVSHRKVADMCGTSITQIEKTYYHLDEESKLHNALEDYFDDDEVAAVEATANQKNAENEQDAVK